MAALVKEAVTDVIDKERHGVHEGSARMADEDCNCLTPTAARYGDKPTSRRTEGPTGGVNVDPNLEGSTALAVCGRSLMARAVGMTKKPANREGLANQQVLERILHFRDIPESMPASVSIDLHSGSASDVVGDAVRVCSCALGARIWALP